MHREPFELLRDVLELFVWKLEYNPSLLLPHSICTLHHMERVLCVTLISHLSTSDLLL